jgi:F-type H+-transporting ATPase subunit delta
MDEERSQTVFDTGQQYLGSVYAKALLGASEKAGNTEEVLEQLESLVSDVLEKLPKLRAALESPRIGWEAKHRLLDQAFEGRMARELLHFLKVVARRERFDCMSAIARAARHQYNLLRGRVRVEVRSASALDDELVQLVSGRLQAALGREIDLVLRVDPDLIGGLVVRVGDTVYDGSVANRLRRLKEELLTKTARQIRENLSHYAVAD